MKGGAGGGGGATHEVIRGNWISSKLHYSARSLAEREPRASLFISVCTKQKKIKTGKKTMKAKKELLSAQIRAFISNGGCSDENKRSKCSLLFC